MRATKLLQVIHTRTDKNNYVVNPTKMITLLASGKPQKTTRTLIVPTVKHHTADGSTANR